MERILGGLPMTQPTSDIPPVEEPILGGDVSSIFRPDETKLDKAKGLADAGLSLFGALVHGVPAQFMGKMGPEFQAKRFRPPQTPAGERYFDVAAEALGKVAEAFPMQPTAFTSPANILAGPAVAQAGAKAADVNAMAQKALQAAGGRLEKAVEKQVYSTMEKGGLPAEILQGMTEGTRSYMAQPQRVEAPRNEMKLYSPAEEAALNLQRGQGRGEGFLNDLRKAGVKDEELEYTGLKEFLAGKQNVSKKEIQDYLAGNKVQVSETQLGQGRIKSFEEWAADKGLSPDAIREFGPSLRNSYEAFKLNESEMAGGTKYSQYTLPGGENYREILLTLPSDSMTTDQIAQKLFGKQMRFLSEAEKDEVVQESRRLFENRTDYRSSHWDQPNVLAHLRVNDRVDADGKKMLLIEEIQSDWHQAGREKGYKTKNAFDIVETSPGRFVINNKSDGSRVELPGGIVAFATREAAQQAIESGQAMRGYGAANGVPDAPFKEDWYQLVLKRALQEAVDKGYDRVGITTGKRQIDRYTDALRANVDAIEYEPFKTDAGEIRYEVVGVKNGKPVVELDDLSYKDLQEKVGKEIAEKIRANAGESLAADRPMRPDWMRLSTDNLSIGGEGMKKYYDEIYPGFLNKYGKKFDAKVGETTLKLTEGVPRKGISGESEPVRYIDITPKMKEALSKGQPMFKEGGLVSNTDTIKARLIEQGMPEDKAFMQALKLANEVQMAKGGLAGLKNLPAAARAAKSKYAEEAAAAGRAAPRSKQEIESIAERIAEQTQPGFVRPDPAFSVNPEGKSRAVYEMEQRTPMIVESTIEDKPLPAVDYEKQLGSVIVGVPGDPTMGQVKSPGSLYEPTRAGKRLMQVGDVTPETPVELYGGPSYGTTQPESYWASSKGAAQGIKNLVDEMAEKYQTDKILGQYMKMSPESSRYAMHNLDALISVLKPDKLPADKMEILNKMVREGDKANKYPQFVGFEDPIDLLLQAQMNPNLRKRISEVLEKPTTAKAVGFPFQGSIVQTAITEPGLRNLETGVTGYSVGQMKPQGELTLSRHPTYEYDIPGQLMGRSKYPIPYELAFPDFSQWFREHPELAKKVDPFNMLKSVGARQKVDPQYVDEIKMYEEAMKRLTGKKKGGKVTGLSALNRK